MERKFSAAAIQFDVKKGRVRDNLAVIMKELETLASKGVRLAVLPEMFSCSFDNENLEIHSKQTKEIVQSLCRFALGHNMAIAGSLPEYRDGQIFNMMVFIDTDGTVKGRYRKIHLFRLTGEHHYYKAGEKIVALDTSIGRVGLMICYDLRFPELARELFKKNVEMIIVSAQWPTPRKAHWQTLIQARAIENQLYVLGSNRTGKEDDLNFPGMSMIVDPQGGIVASKMDQAGSAVGAIDFEQVKAFRRMIPCAADRRNQIYG